MALPCLLIFSSLTLFFSFSLSLSLPSPLLTSITKDPSTLQYTTTIYHKTPLKPTKFLLDLGSSFSWVDCQKNYKSSSYLPIPCNSSLCTSLNSLACSNCYSPQAPGCANNTCSLFPENPVTRKVTLANAIQDSLCLPTTDGRNVGDLACLHSFIISCSHTSLLKGLSRGVSGLVALGRSNISLPAQVSTTFSLPFEFALCLSGSPSAPGVAFFGTGGPYIFLPTVDVSTSLVYTPLLRNPVGDTIITYYGHPSDEYFVGMTSIKVHGKRVPLNNSLLSIDADGQGGTKISTSVPYTMMETSIYKAFTQAFSEEAASMNIITLSKPMKPFKVCFGSESIGSTRLGPAVPAIDLVLENESVYWRVAGANSMVRAGDGVLCLGFIDGGSNPRASIVIGGYQLEDNLLQFDLVGKRVGLTSLLSRNTTCSNFNFTSNV